MTTIIIKEQCPQCGESAMVTHGTLVFLQSGKDSFIHLYDCESCGQYWVFVGHDCPNCTCDVSETREIYHKMMLEKEKDV